VLAHRDVHDWYVFEAASWALAEKRMPADRRRELWREPLPAAELAGRLRTLPLFASVSVDELFRIVSAAHQVRHDPGSTLLKEGTVPLKLHILLDGTVVATTAEAARHVIEPPSAVGFNEALQGQPMRETMRTEGVAVTLVLSIEELRTLLADNTDLVSGLFATLSERDPGSRAPVQPTSAGAELAQLAAGGLTPIEKVLALQKTTLFSRTSVEEMQQVAAVTTTVTMTAGSPLFSESAPAALWMILSGEVSLAGSASAGPIQARSGDIIGSLQTLSGQPLGLAGTVVTAGVALRIVREELFDVLGERPELLRQMFAAMFRRAADPAFASGVFKPRATQSAVGSR
jgi:CRP-like cAMP-binding protein